MAYQLQEINRRIRTDVAEFLAECDENYAQRVSLAADIRLSGNCRKQNRQYGKFLYQKIQGQGAAL